MEFELIVESPAQDAGADRRLHTRIPADKLRWVQGLRLKYGPLLSVVDLSEGGVLVQATAPLRPGTALALEFVGPRVLTVPSRVVRCQIARLSGRGPVYLGACEFKRPLSLSSLQAGGAVEAVRLDLALKDLLAHTGDSVDTASAPGRLRSAEHLPQLLRSIQSGARPSDPLNAALCDVLAELVPALDRGEPAAVLRARLQERLRRIMPGVAIAIGSAPLAGTDGYESIYFSGSPGTAADVLNVEMPAGSVLPEWHFRLLQAGGYLLGLLGVAGEGLRTERAELVTELTTEAEARRDAIILPGAADPVPDTPPAWQRIVVRYVDGRLLKGYTHDFHASRTHFSLWSSIDASPKDRVHIPVSQLKAVFFVRDFDGDPNYSEHRVFGATHGAGRRLEVTFADGEVLVGSTLSYRPDGVGFFLRPADAGANNQRVFVVATAIRHVRFL